MLSILYFLAARDNVNNVLWPMHWVGGPTKILRSETKILILPDFLNKFLPRKISRIIGLYICAIFCVLAFGSRQCVPDKKVYFICSDFLV